MSFPLGWWKLDLSILLGWAIFFFLFLFLIFSHRSTNIFPTEYGVFDYRSKVWEITSQIFGKFKFTLHVSKEIPIDNSLKQLFFTQRTFIWKVLSELIFDGCISFIMTSLLTLPHLRDLESFLSYVISTHLVLITFFHSLLKICCITQRRSCFLTNTMVIKTSQSFKNSVLMVANSA